MRPRSVLSKCGPVIARFRWVGPSTPFGQIYVCASSPMQLQLHCIITAARVAELGSTPRTALAVRARGCTHTAGLIVPRLAPLAIWTDGIYSFTCLRSCVGPRVRPALAFRRGMVALRPRDQAG